MGDPILIEPYDPAWPTLFASIAARLREALGERALRIDHIGSDRSYRLDRSAWPCGQARDRHPDLSWRARARGALCRRPRAGRVPLADGLERAGFRWRADNPDRTKRYFREAPGAARVHIHVRSVGSWAEQLSLLFRDYLRDEQPAREFYAQAKRDLAARFREDREGYVAAKAPTVWAILQRADVWAQATGWAPGPSDA